MIIGSREFKLNSRPFIMGILNMTPDSFSDGGTNDTVSKALKHVEDMVESGADIIDVGGESTRPGHIPVSVSEEIDRTCNIIEQIKQNFDIPVSLDTYKPEVFEAGIKAGIDMINDIWGFKSDDRMAQLAAQSGVACCLMHNRQDNVYRDFVTDVINDMRECVELALLAGVDRDKIILDPGIGFAKDTNQNLIMLNNLEALVALGYPVLLGTSRKSVIGNTLNLPVTEREEGTIATSVLGYMKGCDFFRVHDVKANVRALRMTDSIMKSGR